MAGVLRGIFKRLKGASQNQKQCKYSNFTKHPNPKKSCQDTARTTYNKKTQRRIAKLKTVKLFKISKFQISQNTQIRRKVAKDNLQ